MILNYITWWRYGQKFTSAKFRNSRPLRLPPSGLISMLLSCLLRNHGGPFSGKFFVDQSPFSLFHVSKLWRHRGNCNTLLQSYDNIVLKKRSQWFFVNYCSYLPAKKCIRTSRSSGGISKRGPALLTDVR